MSDLVSWVARRPEVHLTAERGWVNDPLAPRWDGHRYHLWFQHVPDAVAWGPGCHWAHAVSDDLLHWTQTAPALTPGDGDDGCWSGSIVARAERGAGGHRAFYTAVEVPTMAMGQVRVADAASLDGPWTKGAIVVSAPDDLSLTGFRDPFVWADRDGHRMLVGASLGGVEGATLAFSSDDLTSWSFDGVAASRSADDRDPVWTGSLWECPQLVTVDGHEVLVVSVWHEDRLFHVAASVVERDGWRLSPRGWQQLTTAEGYYAPASFVDRDGRPGLFFWIRGLVDDEAGRAGALSVPHLLEVRDGLVVTRLHPTLRAAAPRRRGRSNTALVEPDDLSRSDVVLTAAGNERLRVGWRSGAVTITADGQHTRIVAPGTGVQVLVDGPIVEVLTLGGAFSHVLDGVVVWDDTVGGDGGRWI